MESEHSDSSESSLEDNQAQNVEKVEDLEPSTEPDDWVNENDELFELEDEIEFVADQDTSDLEVIDEDIIEVEEPDKTGDEDSVVFDFDSDEEVEVEAEFEPDDSGLDLEDEAIDTSDIEYDEEDDIFFSPQVDETLRREVEDIEPEPILELGESTIEEVDDDEVEIELFDDEPDSEFVVESDDHLVGDSELRKKAMAKLHTSWLRVNSLKEKYPENDRIIELERELTQTLKNNTDPRDGIIIAEESIEEAAALEKELQNNSFGDVSNLFHFVNSKIILAKKIGFDVTVLEDELDNVSSFIAMSKFSEADTGLKKCISMLNKLPEEQDEILIGLDEDSEQIRDLLEPLPGHKA